MIFDLNSFTKKIVNRSKSLLSDDISNNVDVLKREIDGKNVLVIGGAGTIGASFIKALLRNGKPAQLIVVDINENGLTELMRDVRSSIDVNVPDIFLTYPVNFSDSVFPKILKRYGTFDIVANFAAHKHVRSEKDVFSIEAMIKNNVLNAKVLLDQLAKEKPQHFFCVSTDKAANPVNIMGASKKVMENMIMSYASQMKIATARFANVAFSNGSLPLGFIERLARRQPLSAPADIKRFFVTPDESGEICMMACLLGQTGDTFFPKLNAERDMQTFTYIADSLLREFGLKPFLCNSEDEARQMAAKWTPGDVNYPVYYFNSDTSGEKPYEEFFTESEVLELDAFRMLGVIKLDNAGNMDHTAELLVKLEMLFAGEENDKNAILSLLKEYLPDFRHIEKGRSLDQRM